MDCSSGWSRRRRFKAWKCFFLERDDGDIVAGAASGIEDKEREPAVTGNQA